MNRLWNSRQTETANKRVHGLWLALACLVWLDLSTAAGGARAAPPKRVVSMNLCTDQLAMMLAAPGQLHSVSYLASSADTSVLAAEAEHYQKNHGLAEEIFLMRPDLVIAGTFTTRATVEMLKRLGFRVEEFPHASSFADIRTSITRMGSVLERQEAAGAMVRAFDRELRAIPNAQERKGNQRPIAALYYANSYTSGTGTLADEVVDHAGLGNLGSELKLTGTIKLPLELLVTGHPDLVVTGRRYGREGSQAVQVLDHPALLGVASQATSAIVTDKYWICGLPVTVEAVRRLAAAAQPLRTEP